MGNNSGKSNSAKKPDFFIIGAPKCGTTTLHGWLRTHPDIFLPEKKEPHYFAPHLSRRYRRIVKEADYLSLFTPAHTGQICGEASVLYSFYPETVQAILAFNPQAKIIFLLRNPVDMAVSYHAQLLINLEEDVADFETAWGMQDARAKEKDIPATSQDPDLLQYQQHCALGQHLATLEQIVPKGQLCVALLDDMATDPAAFYAGIIEFLGLENDGRETFPRLNEGGALRSRFLKQSMAAIPSFIKKPLKYIMPDMLLRRLMKKTVRRPALCASMRAQLVDAFAADISIIEKYLNRDLSSWRAQSKNEEKSQ